MKCSCTDKQPAASDFSLIEPALAEYAAIDGSLITVLQKAQDIYGYLPDDLLRYISKRMNIKLSKVMGVVTFYAQFRTKPAGKYLILLCQGTACHVNGSAAIETAVKEYLKAGAGETTENGLFTYNNAACLGCCSLAPAMMIGDTAYGNLTKESAVKILREIEKKEALL